MCMKALFFKKKMSEHIPTKSEYEKKYKNPIPHLASMSSLSTHCLHFCIVGYFLCVIRFTIQYASIQAMSVWMSDQGSSGGPRWDTKLSNYSNTVCILTVHLDLLKSPCFICSALWNTNDDIYMSDNIKV